jgi:glycosyltransferase involved in cell wall biosynthesis
MTPQLGKNMVDSASGTGHEVPIASLGMPVYNGERYIREAIQSALAQSLGDIELVISDNASTDGTERICREFAAADSRVRYFRNTSNVGAHPNFNLAFDRSRGKYFKWLAHDDLLHPGYLKQCVAVLDADPSIVLCQTDLACIDESGRQVGVLPWRLDAARSTDPVRRFAAVLLQRHNCYDFMGVIRRETLAKTPLKSFHGGDRTLLAHVSTLGRFAHVHLMTIRDHANRYTRSTTRPAERARWTDSRNASRFSFPHWNLYGSFWEIVGKMPTGLGDKLRASGVLLAWWFVNWNAVRMMLDLVATVAPNAVSTAERVKQRLFSPAPGIDEIKRKAS